MTSKEEYLKKYLSGAQSSDGNSKKRKKLKSSGQAVRQATGLKILDDDIDLEKWRGSKSTSGGAASSGRGSDKVLRLPATGHEDEEFDDEKPLVAEFIDERPEKVKHLEAYRQNNKWKQLQTNTDDQSSPRNTAQNTLHKYKDSSKSHVQSASERRQTARHDSDSDHSPPRQQRVRHDSRNSPSPSRMQRNRHDSGSDQSPPRNQRVRHDSGSDQSLPRKQRVKRDSGSDESPPRKQQKGRHDSDSDQSPPRKQENNKRSSPMRQNSRSEVSRQSSSARGVLRNSRQLSDSDLSPARLKQKNSHDLSPERSGATCGRKDSDLSPPRGHASRSRMDSDSSPPRGHAARSRNNSDLSPTRSHAPKNSDIKEHGYDRGESSNKMMLAMKTMSGASAGLQSARDMAEEARKLRVKEEVAFRSMDDEVLGRNAAVVHRDKKSGRRRDVEGERREKEESERKKKELEAKYQQWNRGLKQKQEHESNVQDALHEMDKPLARYRDDEDLDAILKTREHTDDPMLAYIKRNKSKKETSTGVVKPRYKGREPPPNRFGLWPGYRWDGVDRSNGFEKKYFSTMAERRVVKDMAHKWSVEDM